MAVGRPLTLWGVHRRGISATFRKRAAPDRFIMQKIYHFIRTHRRSGFLRLCAKASERYLSAWKNENFYDFSRNGERFALTRFADWWGDRPLVVWDVGAHDGEWATLAHGELPSARIVSFEIIPTFYRRLTESLQNEHWSTTVEAGLSDVSGTAKACWNTKYNKTSSMAPRLGDRLFEEEYLIEVDCRVVTGDDYAAVHGIPNLLKIDTEGHEVQVLRGCHDLLARDDGPEFIQFEYGKTYLPSGSTLKQVYDILGPAGYHIGRLYPDHVGFQTYDYGADDFRMGNFIAVRSTELARLLR